MVIVFVITITCCIYIAPLRVVARKQFRSVLDFGEVPLILAVFLGLYNIFSLNNNNNKTIYIAP